MGKLVVQLHYFLVSQVHNVAFAFELMQDGGLKKPKARPEGSCTFTEELFHQKNVELLQNTFKKMLELSYLRLTSRWKPFLTMLEAFRLPLWSTFPIIQWS